jgi:hypothetical protein
MNTIDIRTTPVGPIGRIHFAENASLGTGRGDSASALSFLPLLHPDYLFVEVQQSTSEYVSVRLSDVDNLIKALQKAKEVWACK